MEYKMKPKLNADKMVMNNLDFLAKFGIKSIQIGNTNYKKKGKNTLEITTKKRVK
jgi:hypothetical protein